MKNTFFSSLRIASAAILVVGTIAPNFLLTSSSTNSIPEVYADYTEDYDLIVDKSVDGFDADAGWIDYKITYTNDSAGTLTDVYVTDIVPEGLTYSGVPSSTPWAWAPIQAIVPDADPLTSDMQLIWEWMTLMPGQVGEMIVRFNIDAGADLPNVVNEAKAGVANTDPANGPVCDPYVTGEASTESSWTVLAIPPEPNTAFNEDLWVSKSVIVDASHPVDAVWNPIFIPGDEVTFETEVCYEVDPNSWAGDPNFLANANIYVDESYPSNLSYVSHTAPVNFDSHLVGDKLIWRTFPLEPDGCVTYTTTFEIINIEGPISTDSSIWTTDNIGKPVYDNNPLGTNASGDPLYPNSASAIITTEERDLEIKKRISAINNVACGGDSEPACAATNANDLVTFELEYTLLSGQPRTDIVVLDPFPVGNYISSSPTATNDVNWTLDVSLNSPSNSLPKYTDNYLYWNWLSLWVGQSWAVEFTIQLPEATCSPKIQSNIAYVSIDWVPDDLIMYPITADPSEVDDNDNIILNPNINYLDINTAEAEIENNISTATWDAVVYWVGGSWDPECIQVISTDLVLDGKSSDAWAEWSIIYPWQIIEYTIDYSSVWDGRGYVYLDDRYDHDQLQLIEVVSTWNLLEATDSTFFDRWNSQAYIDNQHAVLYPYYMEAWNNSSSYLTNTPTTDKYYDYDNADVTDSINYYCYERNPELNRLLANAVDQYQQLYVPYYDNYVASGYDKDSASIEATYDTMRDIRTWVSENFNPIDYQDSIAECVFEWQKNYQISEGLSPTWAETVAQAYVDNTQGFVAKTKDYRQFYMWWINFMNNIYIDTYHWGSSATRDNNVSFSLESWWSNYTYSNRKQRFPQSSWLENAGNTAATNAWNWMWSLINTLTSSDNQFMHAWNYEDNYLFHSLWYRNWVGRNRSTKTSYRNAFNGVTLQGMNDRVYWDITDEYNIPQYLIWSIGQWKSPTPEYQWNTSVWYPEAESLLLAGDYNTPWSKYATSGSTEYWAGTIRPWVFQTTGIRWDYTSTALHNLYAGEDSSNSVTYKFKVREDIYVNGFVEWDPICNTTFVATNTKYNITGWWAWRHNGEYTFWCDSDSNLILGTWDSQGFDYVLVPFWEGEGEQQVCTNNSANAAVKNPSWTNTTLFNRHDLNYEGRRADNADWYRSNIAVKSETNPFNNDATHCHSLWTPPFEMSVSKSSFTTNGSPSDNFVPWATVQYSIEACNEWTADMPEMYVKDNIPNWMIYLPTLIWAGQWVTVEDVSIPGEVTWTIGNVAAWDCVTLTPEFQISSDFSWTTMVNDVEVAALYTDSDGNESVISDASSSNNTGIDSVTISQPPEPVVPPAPISPIGKAAIEKIEDSGDDTLGSAGDIITYELSFSNNEPVVAYFNLTDDYSPNLEFISAGTAGNNNIMWIDNWDTVTWNTVEVNPNTTETILVQFRIASSAVGEEVYTNDFFYDYYAVYDCNDWDTDTSNNADTADLPFDLALRKTLTPDLAKVQYSAGDDVSFDLEIFNQGIIDATDVIVADEIPPAGSCFSFDPAKNAWWAQVWTQVQYTQASLPAWQSAVVPLVLTLWAGCQELQITNRAEIASANDSNGDPVTDIDSDFDGANANFDNDGTSEDDIIDESGKDGNDEDDHDYAVINLAQNFDLAITKTLITEGPYHGGDLITYEVIVSNQWTLDGNNVEIIDYILDGFNFDPSYGNNAAEWWTASGANAVATVPLVPAMGASITKEITVQLEFGFEGEELANVVAITEDNAGEDYGLEDLDSDPANEDTDGDGIPDIIDDDIDGDGIPNDEDDDVDGDGTPNDEDPDFNDTEDDVAKENITLGNEMDLSLDKSVDTITSPGPYVAGSTVRFFVDVANETDIDAYSVDVTDYIDPAMFIFTPNNGWIDDGMGNAIQTIPFLAGLDSTQLVIDLVINPTYTGMWLENSAEISAFDDDTNPDNEPPTDVDSNPDTDNNNDDDDEDDEDTVDLPFDFYDLALTKVVSSTGPYYPGSTISFDIEVFNQGTLDAGDIQITDYTPAGLTLTGDVWMDNGTNAVYGFLTIPAWSSDIVSIEYVIDPTYTGVWETNRAEISADDADTYGVEDIDSNPDATNDDTYGTDNEINSDGGNLDTDGDGIIDAEDDDIDGDGIPNDLDDDDNGNGVLDEDEPALDEDDHDPAEYAVSHIYDLALTKTFTSSDPTPIVPGGDVTYTITVYNQGTWIANDIEITDYLAPNLILNDPNWTLNGSGFAVHNTLLGPIPAGESIQVPITVTIDPSFTGGSITNNAEISDDDSEENGFTDIDSTADANNVNDPSSDDNGTDGDGTIDEDDHDPETITVDVYDLAIQKTINTLATQMPVYPWDAIFYTIEVFNQGTLTASNIEVTDYTPTGLTLADPNWTLVDGNPTTIIAGPIVAGGSETVDIRFTIDEDFTGTSFTNVAEISADDADTYGTADPDSDPDADNSNDPEGDDNQLDGDWGIQDTDGDGIPDNQDDDIDGDGIPNNEDDDVDGDGIPNDEDTNIDEDDSDPAMAVIGQIYDLALSKTLDEENTVMPIVPGGDMTFLIEVINQGTLPAANIELTDTLPAQLTLNDSAWTASGTQASMLYTETILPGESVFVPITVTIDSNYGGGSLRNNAEISNDDSELYGTTDVDSTPDTDPTNDPEGTDGQTDGDGTDDEDDHDWLDIEIDVYDLALTKTVNTTATNFPVYPGDTITYTIEVFNQGTLPRWRWYLWNRWSWLWSRCWWIKWYSRRW